MFIGHYGVALAVRKIDSEMPLGLLFIATQLVDILWAPFILLGIEQVEIVPGIMEASPLDFTHYPYTHSLIAFVGWSLLAFVIARFLPIISSRTKTTAAGILALVVFSHFLLDWITHRPDITLAGEGSHKLGLGLWNNAAASYTVESLLFIVGAIIYMKSTRPLDRIGRLGIPIMALFLLFANLLNLWGPPPPNVEAIGWGGLFSYLIFAGLAFWLDKHRVVKAT